MHPLFLASLALLLLNDHVLKGADVLPPWLTGKLSDIVGPVVAVGLLSALVARSAAQVKIAAGVVGVVFAAINLSPQAAGLWSSTMGLLGFPWEIVVDPTDLVGLLMLPPAVWLVLHTARQEGSGRTWTLPQAAVATAACAACIATSPPIEPGQFFTDVAILNNTPNTLLMRVRNLNPQVQMSCDEVATNPSEFLSPALFDQAVTWEVPSKEHIPVLPEFNNDFEELRDTAAQCHAAILEIDGMAPQLIFWPRGLEFIGRSNPLGQRQNATAQTISVVRDGADGFEPKMIGDINVLFEPHPTSRPNPDGECAVLDAGQSIIWSEPVPTGTLLMTSVDIGLDDCARLELLNPANEAVTEWYLCTPEGSFPFEAGDLLDIEVPAPEFVGPGNPTETLVITREATEAAPHLRLIAHKGKDFSDLSGIEVTLEAIDACEGDIDPCGNYRRAATASAAATDSPSDTIAIDQNGRGVVVDTRLATVELFVGLAAQQIVLNPACTGVDMRLGSRLEAVSNTTTRTGGE